MKNEPRDLYADLGLTKTAAADEIKKAYRRLSKKHHPDRNPGDAGAEDRFKTITEAYETLSDPDARARYDETGEYGRKPGGAADNHFQDTLNVALQDVIVRIGKMGGDLAMNNLVIHMRVELEKQNRENRMQLLGLEKGLEELRKAVGRFSVEDEDAADNKLEASIRAMIRTNRDGADHLEAQHETNLRILEYLAKAKYRTDGPGPTAAVRPYHKILMAQWQPDGDFTEFK